MTLLRRHGALRSGIGAYRPKLGRLITYISKYRKLGYAAVAFLLMTTLLQLPMPLVTRYVIDDVLTGRSGVSIYEVGAFVVALQIVMSATRYFSIVLSAKFRTYVLADIESAMYEHACRLPYEYHLTRQSGYLMSRISGDAQSLHGFLAEGVAALLQNLFMIVVGIVAIMVLDARLAVICISCVPIYVVLIVLYSRKIKLASGSLQEVTGQAMGIMQEGLSDNQILKLMSAENYFASRAKECIKTRSDASLNFQILNARYGASTSLLAGIVNAALLVVGGVFVLRGEMTVGTLIAFTAYVGYVFNPIKSTAATVGNLQTSIVCLDRISEIMDLDSEHQIGDDAIDQMRGFDVVLKGVGYKYAGRNGALTSIDLSIGEGERIALVGASGSGKTTIGMILTKMLTGYTGRIELGGVSLDTISVAEVRNRIVAVPQRISMFTGTIRENILIGRQGISEEQIRNACQTANILEFIDSLPEGLDTSIGVSGAQVSGGERQRLAIARAVLGEPDILILDEATSDLDSASEVEINSAIREIGRERSVMIIAHRLSSATEADRIYVFDGGRIVDTGTHGQLLERCTMYREMCEAQSIV
jgi:subfamily B ATP-binding cassette protein MsbA